jgi:cytochrome c554/c'-like protein
MSGWRGMACWLCLLATAVVLGPMRSRSVSAAEEKPPSRFQYTGPGSCASSSCHGAVQPRSDSRIPQNEYSIWIAQDRHANAYNVLGNAQSHTIARNLGLKESAQQSQRCLPCHALDVSEAQRARSFELDDGVSCESCHGPASAWLGPHTTRGWTHAQSVALGMIDTKNLQVRAQQCLTCHLGTAEHSVDHELLAAGHPVLTFELDSYSAVMPRHWKEPLDKDPWINVRAWSLGQAVQLRDSLLQLQRRAESDRWPEYAEYDCVACHHPLVASSQSWRQQLGYAGRTPGAPPWNPAHFIVLQEFSGAEGQRLSTTLQALAGRMDQPAPSKTEVAQLSAQGAKEADELVRALAASSYDENSAMQFMRELTADSRSISARGERTAEQALLGFNTVFIAYNRNHPLAHAAEIKAAVDKLFQQLQSPSGYDARTFSEEMERINRLLR